MSKSKKNTSKLMILCIIALFTSSVGLFFLITPSSGQVSTQQSSILVISEGNDESFLNSLRVDKADFYIKVISASDSLQNLYSYDIIFIFDANLNPSKINAIEKYTELGGSLVILMGNNLHTDPGILLDLGIITSLVRSKNEESMLLTVKDENHILSKKIDWNSAPDMKIESMTVFPVKSFSSSVKRIIDVYPASKNLEIPQYSSPILVEMSKGRGNIVLFTGWLEEGFNKDFKVWPYFNYLLYTMAFESMNKPYDAYADWSYSPVPHLTEQIILLIIVVVLGVLAISLFLVVKKKSTTAMDQSMIEALRRQAAVEERKRLEESKELEKRLEGHVDLKDDWEVIGIHRQLGGFLYTLFIGLILVIPQLLVSNFIMPQIIQPYPQAAGWYSYAYNVFQIAWLLFDFGTSYALAKYFSQYRVKNPEKAIHYIQIFFWWQMFTGLAQITIFAFIGSIILPQTVVAHMTWVFVTYSLIQYPGFFLVFMYTFQGMQRSDYYLILYIAWEVAFLAIGQVIFCYVGRMWGAANPIIGEALGAGIGYSIARVFDYWLTFFLSIYLFKKLGFSPSTCFRIDFTKDEFKESMRYGSKLAFGESFVQIGWFIQILITTAFIANYSNELGYFQLTWNIGMIVQMVSLYGNTLLGAFSESTSHNKKILTKLYMYQAFRWGNYFAFFIISVLFAVGEKFLIGAAGPEYGGPAVKFLVPLLIFHACGVYSWLVDAVYEGTGRTDFAAYVWIVEQTLRAILLFVLVITLKNMVAVLFAYIPAVFLKDIIAWIIVRYKITDFKLYKYKTFVAPAISAVINFIVLFFVSELLWAIPLGDKMLNTVIIFLLGIFGFLFFYAFLDGLLGGYDNNTLKELERAVNLTPGKIGVLSKTLYKAARAGARISPLHNKFKIDIYEAAMKEAYDLTLEKKILKI